MARHPVRLDAVEAAVDLVLERLGRTIVLGLPLGLGKPVEFVNALYRRACADRSIQLRILTALSLAPPRGGSALERAFLEPFVQRVFGGVPQLDYVAAQRSGTLPANVVIEEFFLLTGTLLGNAEAQRHYINSNYTHAARDVFARGCNLVAQIISPHPDGQHYSLSCNPDTGPEILRLLRSSDRPHLVIGQVHPQLPYFGHDAERRAGEFDVLIAHPSLAAPLFSTPKMPVSDADHAIGLYASALVRDGGTLQVGIGSLGDAVVNALLLRQRESARYRHLINAVAPDAAQQALIADVGGLQPLEQGLYGATEMFVDGFWHLLRGGILKRRVYDFAPLQQLINERRCLPDALQADVLDALDAIGVRAIRGEDFAVLQYHGFFNDQTRYEHGELIAPDGTRVRANFADPDARRVIAAQCLGSRLRRGWLLHGGFFLGPRDFYDGLQALSDEQRDAICLCGVDKINQLDLNPALYRQQRRHARFLNTCMMVTLSGAFVSDGLDDGRVVSGVGGQYNFVAQAHQLEDGRSVLMLRATRESGGRAHSNVVFNYGHITIPRHLRDLVITEYGIADLRSKTDNEIAKALIGIADSRFQPELLAQAQKVGKIESGWQIPDAQRHNTPEQLAARLARERALLPALPFGSDFDEIELALLPALGRMREQAERTAKWRLLLKLATFRPRTIPAALRPYLQRLQLDAPRTLEQRVAQMLLVQALQAQTPGADA